MDEIDLKIIDKFYKLKRDQEKSLTDLCKIILEKKEIKNREYNFIHRRILAMAEKKLFKIGTNSHVHFILDLDRVFIQRISFPTRRTKGIAILLDDKFQIFEL